MENLDITIQIKMFYEWLENNKLSATEISLWHALLHIGNEVGWPKTLSVPISKLSKMTGMKKDAIYTARDNLEKSGRIEIIPGKGSKAAQYRIIPFVENYYTKTPDIEDVSQEDIHTTEDDNSVTDPPTELHDKRPQIKIFRKMQDLIMMPSPNDIHQIKSYLNEGMEDQLLCESIKISEGKLPNKKPMDKWKYAKGIMRTWYNNGIRTFEEYQKHEKEREAQINGGNKERNKYVQPKAEPRQKTNGMRKFRVPK